MKSTFATSALALLVTGALAGCGSAPTEATDGLDEGATELAIAPSTLYVVDRAGLGNTTCSVRKGRTGQWNATVLGRSALSNYCIFEWVGTTAPVTSLLPSGVTETSTARKKYGDLPVVAPSGTPLVDATWTQLRSAFLKYANATSVPVPAGAPKSFVAVVDSARQETTSNEASTGTYEHGEVVGRVVREESRNTVGVLSTLALPRNSSGRIDLKGGYFGFTSDTSLAIVRAVDAWLARTANDGIRRPLVVNLSLGWEPAHYFGSAISGSTALLTGYGAASVSSIPQQSVFAAIEYANCAGALVLAAAGNVSQGPSATKTMTLPAAWESVPAPTSARCEQFGFGPSFRPAPRANTSPRLVYAVGAVDGADAEVFNARPTGMPRLVAYGHAVSVARASATTVSHTGVMTGSSIATAVASGAASLAWAFAPTTSSHDVAQALYESAVGLSRPAKDCSLGMCNTRRVSVCGVVSKLSLLASSCTVSGAFTGSAVKTSVNPASLGIAFTEAAASAYAAPSPVLVNEAVNPTVKPMPVSGGCDLCGFFGNTAYFDFSYPSSSIAASITFDTGVGMSFAPSTEYMQLWLGSSSAAPSSGTITFSDPVAGWTSTQELAFFF